MNMYYFYGNEIQTYLQVAVGKIELGIFWWSIQKTNLDNIFGNFWEIFKESFWVILFNLKCPFHIQDIVWLIDLIIIHKLLNTFQINN